MNIFQKTCPECAASNSADAISCECGYVFDPEALASADPTEYAHQQDQLYRDYLDARIAQAEAELVVARELASADPESTYKASTALLAEQAVNALRAERKQLSVRISSSPVKPSAGPARRVLNEPSRHKPPPAPAPRTSGPTVAPKMPPRPIPVAKAPVTAPTATAPKRPIAAAKPPPARRPTTPAPPVAHASKPPMASATRTARAMPPQPPHRFAVAPAGVRPQPKRIDPLPVPRPIAGKNGYKVPNLAARPGESFRRLQSQKAEAIARTKTDPGPTAPAPKASRHPAPADIPPVLLSGKEPTQECPNCTATLAANMERCTCGYMLARPGEEVPSLTLDAGALAILTDGIGFNSSNRRR